MIDKFTKREMDVFICIANGRSNKKIAELLSISRRTVESHTNSIMNKINIRFREGIIDFAEKHFDYIQIQQQYLNIIGNNSFQNHLKLIREFNKNSEITVQLIDKTYVNNQLIKNISTDLENINIKVVKTNANNIKNIVKHSTVYFYSKNDDLSSEYKIGKNVIIVKLHNPQNNNDDNQEQFLSKYTSHITFYEQYYYTSFLSLVTLLTPSKIVKQALKSLLKIGYGNSISNNNVTQNEVRKFKYSRTTFYKIFLLLSMLILIINSSFIIKFFSDTITVNDTKKNITQVETWNLPLIIPHHVERKKVLKTILDKFQIKDKKNNIIVGLYGLGGIGKTTLAKYIIRTFFKQYSFSGWFNSETKELLNSNYFALGEKYHLFTNNMSNKQKISEVKKWFSKQHNILLVYDNVPDIDMLYEYLPDTGHILVTSRNYKLPNAIEIDVMSDDEATDLISNLIPKNTENTTDDIKLLAKKLGNLPLALSQAGSYIAENFLTIKEYLLLFANEKNKLLLNETMPVMDVHEPSYITWNISMKILQQDPEYDQILKLLECIACCYSEYIPKKLLLQYIYGTSNSDTVIKLNKILNLLRKYSLVKISPDSISVHRLVHLWLNNQYFIDKTVILEKSIASIKNIAPQKQQIIENIDLIKSLLPHIEYIMSQLQPTANQNLGYIKFILYLTDIYSVLSNYEKNKNLLEEILDIQKKHFAKNYTELSMTLEKLGETYHLLGNYKLAINLLEQALNIQENHFVENHIQIADNLVKQGLSYMFLGKYKKSRILLEQALTIQEKNFGKDHIDVAHTLGILGQTYLHLYDFKKGKELLERTLSIEEEHYGVGDLRTYYALIVLAETYLYLGDYQKSKNFVERALNIGEKYYPEIHYGKAHIFSQLGRIHLYSGECKKSKELLEHALNIGEKYFHVGHSETSYILCQLGESHLCLGDYQKSKELLERALSIQEKDLGKDNLDTMYTLFNLGRNHLYLGDYKKSKELLERALYIQEKDLGKDNIETIHTLYALGQLYFMIGDAKKSEQILLKILPIMTNFYGEQNITTLSVLENLGILYGFLGNYDKSKELFDKVFNTLNELYGENNIYTVKALANLGNIHRLLNNERESKKLLQKSLDLLERFHNYDQITVANVIGNLNLLNNTAKNNVKTKKSFEQILFIFKNQLHPEHFNIKKTIEKLNEYNSKSIKKNDNIDIGYPIIF